MAVIDEEGNLFGVVNIIDLLVVLVVLAVVAAGVALVTGSDGGDDGGVDDTEPEPEPTRYATLAVTSDVSNLSARIEVDDTLRPLPSGSNLTVTDTYAAPSNGRTRVVARVRYDGSLPTVDGSAVRVGQAMTVQTGDLRTKARLLAANESSGTSLPVDTTPVVLEAQAGPAVLDSIQQGDELALDGRTVATVESVTAYPGTNRIRIGTRLRTLDRKGVPVYGGHRLTIGSELPLATSGTSLTGEVANRGSLDPAGDAVPVTVAVEWRSVSPAVATQLADGMRERHRGANATVRNVTSEPASVVVTTAEGEVVERTHPRNRDVRVTVETTARRVNGELRFHGRSLRVGNGVTLDFGRVTVEGTVVDLRTN